MLELRFARYRRPSGRSRRGPASASPDTQEGGPRRHDRPIHLHILISNRDLIMANWNIDATFMIKICDLFLR